MDTSPANERISQEVMALLGTGRQVETFSGRLPDFSLAQAYEVVARVCSLRRARGETPIGRKIGFTNRSLWGDLGIAAPVWNYVFDRTVRYALNGAAEVSIAGMPEPRIEPELVLHLGAAPAPGLSLEELMDCIDWVAPGFEVVFSIFPDWAFSAADAAAAYGVHGALVVGDRLDVRAAHASELSTFTVALEDEAGLRRDGHASNVLGGPVHALKFLVDEIARYPGCEPLKADEIITTGTLTEAMPLRPNQAWRAEFQGIALNPLRLRIGPN
ncbi:MAG: 2-keto-4-pentenoate hydratase [Reyranellaceae bacterium]